MERWELRVLIFKRDGEFEAECIDAAAVGAGGTPFEAMDDLVRMLNVMAIRATESGARLVHEPSADDLAIFQTMQSGGTSDDVWGHGEFALTLTQPAEPAIDDLRLVAGAA